MRKLFRPLLTVAIFGLAAGTTWAGPSSASSASSQAVDSASTSVGSLSTSVEGSSTASSPTRPLRAGLYRITRVAEVAQRPTHVRITLAAADAGADGMHLTLPRATLHTARLGVGDTVAAKARPYGLEFARTDTATAFYLAVDEAWMREMRTQAVTL